MAKTRSKKRKPDTKEYPEAPMEHAYELKLEKRVKRLVEKEKSGGK